MVLSEDRGSIKEYSRPGDMLTINGFEVKDIAYHFLNGKFYEVDILIVGAENIRALKGKLVGLFGEPTRTSTETSRDLDVLFWDGDRTEIALSASKWFGGITMKSSELSRAREAFFLVSLRSDHETKDWKVHYENDDLVAYYHTRTFRNSKTTSSLVTRSNSIKSRILDSFPSKKIPDNRMFVSTKTLYLISVFSQARPGTRFLKCPLFSSAILGMIGFCEHRPSLALKQQLQTYRKIFQVLSPH
jgi:hypothetical protein